MQYSNTVMDQFMNPRNTGQIPDADGVGIIGSEECGDQIRVWIKVQDGKLTEVRHQVFGCPAAIAACSMMTELAIGLTLEEAVNITDNNVADALGGLPPQKYHCSNLAASALHKAIENYQTGQNNGTDTVNITTLVNNIMPAPLLAEHGLSFWIEYGGKNILFDTGQTDALVKNAELLDIDLSKTDAIILSHGHYDHTGGLEAVLKLAPNAIVYLHPDAPKLRYSCPPQKPPKDISMPPTACRKIAESVTKGNVIYTARPESIYPGVTVTGTIPRTTSYEDTGGSFFLDKKSQAPDQLNDDQALTIFTAKGLVVIVGCSHAGIVNTLEYIKTLTQEPIYAVLGGTHLRAASKERLKKTFEAIKKYELKLIAPCHCSGSDVIKEFKNRFSNAFLDIQANIRMTI
ncbi:MAG: iron-sulfur cluster assembly scaffold protein [Phycisphaerae bacterium]|nr:iron-sulfur cluster assembly scaffold protein [Phycisphaerae bacterium]